MDDLTAQITACLQNYTADVTEKIGEAIEETGKEMLENIKTSSPVKTGKYKKGWKLKTEKLLNGSVKVIAYNKTHGHLTHLLEFGHAKRNGGRTQAFTHIKPAEEKAIRDLQRRIEEAISR